jgi:hypothetical protein
MTRSSGALSLFVLLAWAAPGCSGDEFTASGADDGSSAASGGSDSGGKGGGSGNGGSSKGGSGGDSSGSTSGGSSSGGSSTGGSSSGGSSTGGSSTGGSPTGGDAGDGASGGRGGGGMGGSAGTAVGGAGAGNGGIAGRAGSSSTGGRGGTAGGGAGSGGAGFGGKGGSGGAGFGGKGGSGGLGGSVQTGCPPTPPLVSTACSYSDDCTYGTHPLASCRDVYNCVQGHWQQTQAPNCGNPPSCNEASAPPVVGADCTPIGYECRLDQNVFCMCAANCASLCSLPPIWHCFGPPPSCPASLPNQGQPCSGSMTCTYGTCASQTSVRATCQNGSWNWQSGICAQ